MGQMLSNRRVKRAALSAKKIKIKASWVQEEGKDMQGGLMDAENNGDGRMDGRRNGREKVERECKM